MFIFKSLTDALRAGFEIYDCNDKGYIVRARTQTGWALALVLTPNASN